MRKDPTHIDVATYYERAWTILAQWYHVEKTLCIHYGYHDTTTKGFIASIYRMNDLVAELLQIKSKKPTKLLDAGCGVGGTSIYLAKKYPNSEFIGITNTPKQVEMGTKFIQERNLSNCQILYGDYTQTNFPNDYFDDIFAIESVSYASELSNFLKEMNRILKPGGKLIILDGFQTDKKINTFIKRIYKAFLYGRGYQTLEMWPLQSYLKLLKQNGFYDIYHKDISTHVARTQIRGVLLAIPFFISFLLKYIFTLGKINSKNNYSDFSIGVSVLTPFIALTNTSRYYMTYSTKKER